MGFEREFADLMQDQVVIRPYLGQDGYARAIYGDPITYRARVVGRSRRVIAPNGEEVVSTTQSVILNSTGIDARSQITLPSGFVPSSPPILAILRDKDDRGLLTETIYS